MTTSKKRRLTTDEMKELERLTFMHANRLLYVEDRMRLAELKAIEGRRG